MAENKILQQASKCPVCSEEMTVARKAVGEKHRDKPVQIEIQVVPLEQPTLAGVMVDAIAVHYDICARCGTKYATLSELVKVPVSGQPPPRQFRGS